jgi:phage shock protein E
MLNFIKKLLSLNSVDLKTIYDSVAIIIDVRTPAEFKGGHLKNSKNIPLQQLKSEMKKLDVKKPIITCCASGMRSSSAKSILQQNGFEAYNGGGWSSLQNKLK